MTKSKEYRQTTTPRYRLKIYRQMAGQTDPELVKEFANSVEAEWNEKFGKYREAYEWLKQFLGNPQNTGGKTVPKALYGLYRSFLFKAMKRVPAGDDPQTIIDYFEEHAGLDSNVMWEILQKKNIAQKPDQSAQSTTRAT